MLPFGINVTGYVSSNVSLGITARHFIKLFLDHGIPVAIRDLDYGRSEKGRDFQYRDLMIKPGEDPPYSVNMFFLALWQIPRLASELSREFLRDDRFNTALLWYEVPWLAPIYREALSLFDVILCGSSFVKSIFDTYVRSTFTFPCRHPIYFPEGISSARDQFHLPEGKCIFISSFDPHSDPERKNPMAVIDAFQTAFVDGRRNVHLVVKLNNADVSTGGMEPDQVVGELERRCGRDPRIDILAMSLDYREVLSLYAACDVFVSLHRSEGLGMAPLECMLLGKPVIATAWSGNMSYMTHRNTCLVSYELIPYSGMGADGSRGLRKRAMWADPSVAEAAEWMRLLAENEVLRGEIGRKALKDAQAYDEEAKRGEFLRELEQILRERHWLKSRLRDKRACIDRVKTLVQREDFRGWKGFKRRVRREMDKHLLWRFRH